jgi:succinoglycan biosynthesis transport protein ExoP
MSQNKSLIPAVPGRRPPMPAVNEAYSYDLFRRSDFEGGSGSNSRLEPWRFILRRKGVLALSCILGVVCAVLVTLSQSPVYEARASIEVLNLSDNPIRVREMGSTPIDAAWGPEYDLQTKIRMLQSQSLLERVVSKLHFENKLVTASKRPSLWRRLLGTGESETQTNEQVLALAVSEASNNLKVRGLVNSKVVEIVYKASEPSLAAKFINTLLNEFIQQDLESRWETSQHTESFFRDQLAEVKRQLEQSEQQLQNYGNNVGLLFTSQKEDVTEDKLRQIQQELLRAQADRVTKQSSYLLTSSTAADSLPAVLDDPTLKEYQIKLTDLRRELAALDTTLTSANPKVKRVQSQIRALESALETARGNIVHRLQNEFVSAQRREQMLSSAYVAQSRLVGAQAAKIARYNLIKRDVETNRQLYDNMLQRVKETGIAGALHASSIRVIDPAKPPAFLATRDFGVNAFLGLMCGGFFGCVFLAVGHRFNRTIQEPGETSCLNAAELGVIPTAPSAGLLRKLLPLNHDAETRRDVALTVQHRAVSPMAESIRTILTTLLYANTEGKHPGVIVVSSANPSEGKTTISCNLAIALARVNKRVVLVDGDMRAPRLHEIFEVENRWGLSDLLCENGRVDPSPLQFRKTSIPNLVLLTRGAASAEDLVYSVRLPGIIQRLREEFDAVVIDTPPVLYASDARIFARYADSVVLVIRARHTTRDAAQLAVNRFSQDGIQILGTILNDWNPERSTAYGYEVYRTKGYYRYAKPPAREEDHSSEGAEPVPKNLDSILKI